MATGRGERSGSLGGTAATFLTVMQDMAHGLLAKAIVTLLRDGTARTARQIVGVLRHSGFDGLERCDVNVALYRTLAGVVKKDIQHRWSLALAEAGGVGARGRAEQAAIGRASGEQRESREPGAGDVGAHEAGVRSSLLRTVQRLRSGVPPHEHVQELTVGDSRVISGFKELLGAASRRWVLVAGDYGEGKSHALALLRDMAHRGGFATCHVAADAWGCALNHPQRFLPALLSTLELPGRSTCGYAGLLRLLMLDAGGASRLMADVVRHLPGAREIEVKARYYVGRVVLAHRQREQEDSQAIEAEIRDATYHLTGASIQHRAASNSVREVAYGLLGIAIGQAKVAGARGLVLTIDEFESVFTKLHNRRSRLGAYRVLSALCEGPELKDLRVALAMTPDSEVLLDAAIPEMSGASGLECERVAGWASALAGRSVRLFRCRTPTGRLLVDLAARVGELYRLAYPNAWLAAGPRGWDRFVREAVRRPIPLRLLVRLLVDFLDARRYTK